MTTPKVVVCRPSHGGAFRKHEMCFRKLTHACPDWDELPLPGCPCVDIARAVLAERCIEEKADVVLWIDGDMTFTPSIAKDLVGTAWDLQALVGVLYTNKKRGGEPQAAFVSGTKKVACFEKGGLYPVEAIGFGMVAHPVSIFEKIAEHWKLPKQQIGEKSYRAWFSNDPHWDRMHSDDYSFCRRALRAGIPMYCDTRHRVGHIGEYVYTLEDMAGPKELILDLAIEQLGEEQTMQNLVDDLREGKAA